MKHATSQFLFSYWNDIRAGRLAPKRFEIEPARMATILPDTFILERSKDGFLFRLAGTRIADRFKADLRNTGFADIWSDDDAGHIRDILDDVSSRGGVGRIDAMVEDDHGNHAVIEYVILPLIHHRDAIDRMVGAMSVTKPAAWLGSTPITSQALIDHEIVWPDGRPHELAKKAVAKEEPSLAPHVRTARIVRADRRLFRVYDGGRKPDTSPQ